MKTSAQMTGDFLNLSSCESALLCMSTNYIGGKMMVVRSQLFDLTLYVTHVPSNPLANLNPPIHFVAMVPLQVEAALQTIPEHLHRTKHVTMVFAPVAEYPVTQ